MKIGLWETFPILEGLLFQCSARFFLPHELQICRWEKDEHYHLFLTDRRQLPPTHADLALIPGGEGRRVRETGGILLTGGMNRADPVTFSSIGEDRALLCLQQEIALCGREIGPFEKPVPFLRRYSLYKNLAAGFALSLAEILFGEESC